MNKKVLVVGGGIEGIQSALDLADSQIKVTLIEKSPSLHTNSSNEENLARSGEGLILAPKLLKAVSHPNIKVITNASVLGITGNKGNFRATVIENPRYVDTNTCTSCGRCEQACPVDIFPNPSDNSKWHRAVHRGDFGLNSVPASFTIDKSGTAPCTAACPAGVNAHSFVSLISKGKFAEALDLITEAIPFPRVLGRVCSHPCEKKCTRAGIDKSVSICALKRFVADNNSTHSSLIRTHTNGMKLAGNPRVAIVGAGPAGLTAARDLARMGHKSTVFEALPVPGGMITVGMPRFRLPREVRQADIDDIVRLGIEIRTSTPIGQNLTLQDLKRQGYEAILIATGAHKNQRLGIAGENLPGVIDSIALLQALNLKQPITIGTRVVVIGGGYTAIDSARTAIRIHCEKVRILYRRSLEEMPANAEEVAEAQEEGVGIEYLVAPVRIVGKDGRVVGVECICMGLGEPDSSGRRRPVPIQGSEFFIEADNVIIAVGQRPDLSFLGGDKALTDGGNRIIIDRLTMATRVPGIFAAGDVAGEPGTLIEAIAAGRRSAVSIDKFLRGEDIKRGWSLSRAAGTVVDVSQMYIPPVERQRMPCLPLQDRVCNFEEVDLGLNAEMAIREANRCLHCTGCSECLQCERACELNAIDHSSMPRQMELDADAIIAGQDAGLELILSQDNAGKADSSASTRRGIYSIAPPSQDWNLSRASAIAARVMVDLAKSDRTGKSRPRQDAQGPTQRDAHELASPVPGNGIFRGGIFVCGCGGSISDVLDTPGLVEYSRALPGIAYSGGINYACTDKAALKIKTAIKEHHLTHVILAACSCCNLGQICLSCSYRRIICKSNLMGNEPNVRYEFVNIREHCARVHRNQPAEAEEKARSLIRAALGRARESRLPSREIPEVYRNAVIIGSGIGGMRAAVDLAVLGFQTIINQDIQNKIAPPLKASGKYHRIFQQLKNELVKSGAVILSGTKLIDIDSIAGGYRVTFDRNGELLTFPAGAIILDSSTGSNGRKSKPALPASVEEGKLPYLLSRAFNNGNNHKAAQTALEPVLSPLPGIFLCSGQTSDVAEALVRGSAAAAKASILLSKGISGTEKSIATIDERRCRGCGTCVSICQSGAIQVDEKNNGTFIARINERLCQGCGVCVAHCPSGALSQDDCNDNQIAASLEAILS